VTNAYCPALAAEELGVALSQVTPWLRVLRVDLAGRHGDISAVKGLRLGAAPGPDRTFLQMPAIAPATSVKNSLRVSRYRF